MGQAEFAWTGMIPVTKRKIVSKPARTALVLLLVLLAASIFSFSCTFNAGPPGKPGDWGDSGKPSDGKEQELKAFFIDVGQGDSCLIRARTGDGQEFTLLVDAGPAGAGDEVVDFLKEAGVRKIDHLVFTHPHEDHIGGGKAVLDAFDVGNVYMPRTSHTTNTYEQLLLAIESKGLTVTEARAGKVILEKDEFKAEFLGPMKSYENLNDCSAVMSLTFGEKVLLLMGDAEEQAEKDMFEAGLIPDAEVLKAGHHGASTSTTGEFLGVSRPSIAVISVGPNPYGHPSKAVLDQLERAGVKVYRTDLHGTVEIVIRGDRLSVSTR